jgi:pSer/pThr/pTyr-binding forkhead associated (FHA) protein
VPLELTIQERGAQSRSQVVPKDVVFIGRRDDNDVVLPYTFISGRHGRVFRRNGTVFVEDMGSTNGILVNGEQLTPMAPRALRPEDLVQIEKIVIQARWLDDVEEVFDAEPTLHEPLPAVTSRPTPRPSVAAYTQPASQHTPSPTRPKTPAPSDAPATMWEIQTGVLSGSSTPSAAASAPAADYSSDEPASGTIRLSQASLSDVLANARHQRQADTVSDPYFVWVIAFQALGLVTALAAIVLLVFVLLA